VCALVCVHECACVCMCVCMSVDVSVFHHSRLMYMNELSHLESYHSFAVCMNESCQTTCPHTHT